MTSNSEDPVPPTTINLLESVTSIATAYSVLEPPIYVPASRFVKNLLNFKMNASLLASKFS